MDKIRHKLDAGFARMGEFIYKYRWLTIIVVLLSLIPPILQLPHVTLDTSTESFLHENDPAIVDYNEFRDQFGRDELMILAFNPPEVFDFSFLDKLREIHNRLETEVPHIEEVTSLINARVTRGKKDELIVEDLLEKWPKNEIELQAIKNFVLDNPTYRNLLISENGKFTTIVIRTNNYSAVGAESDDDLALENFEEDFADETSTDLSTAPREFLTDAENSEAVAAVQEIIAGYKSADFPIYFSGSNVVADYIKRAMQNDMARFIRLTLIAIALFLLILFRRIVAVVWPLLIVILSLLATVGLMTLTGTPLKLPTTILPSFLLAVGIGYCVHILSLFFRRINAGEDKRSAIIFSLEHAGLPIVLTSLTTAGGLLSFASSGLAPISELGIFAPYGVMIALFLSLVLLPALLAITPFRPVKIPKRTSEKKYTGRLDKFIISFGSFATRRHWLVLSISALLIIVALVGIAQIDFAHKPLEWLPKNEATRIATQKIDTELRGSISMELVLDKREENGWYSYEDLQKLNEVGQFAESIEKPEVFFGRAFSLADILKEINKALHENSDEFHAIPQGRELIAQEFLLFENSGSDDLEDFTDSQFSKARMMLKSPFRDAKAYKPLFSSLKQKLTEEFGNDIDIKLTGIMVLLVTTLDEVMTSMVESYFYAFVIITFLMMLMIGSIRMGALSMIPNLMPILLTLGFMGWFGLTLDVFTLLIGSIALGLAVDDTIHFMHNFRRYYNESGDVSIAVQKTLEIAGRAMLFTTLILTAGFFIFMFASMGNLFNFGLLTGFTISMALLADFLLAPALMQIFYGTKKS
ncbi:MAG: hypothetical protein DWQ05_17735 [Calditrichaeota bacterium]|nr:MAG: hypothetical protein DWQ05_17735 [Calditrichota bacterium]